MHILLTHKNADFLEDAERYLRDHSKDISVDTADSPDFALEKIAENRCDIVVIGHVFDAKDTLLDFIINLRRIQPNIKIVLFTDEKCIGKEMDNLGIDKIIDYEGRPSENLEKVFLCIEYESKLMETSLDLKRSERLYKGMYETMIALSEHNDLDYLLATIAHETKVLLDATDCNIYFYRHDTGLLKPIYSNHPRYSREILEHPIEPGEGLTGKVAETRIGGYINYNDTDDVSIHVPNTDSAEDDLESIMAVPLQHGGELLGVISVGKFEYLFSDEDLERLNLFAKPVEIALRRAKYLKEVQETQERLAREKNRVKSIHEIAIRMKDIWSEADLYRTLMDSIQDMLDFGKCRVETNTGDVFETTERGEEKEIRGNTDIYESNSVPLRLPLEGFGTLVVIPPNGVDLDGEEMMIMDLLISYVTESIERIRYYEKIRESEEKFKSLAETSPTAIFVYKQKILYVNSACEEMSGYGRDELLEMDFFELIHPEQMNMVQERGLARMSGDDVPSRYEVRIKRKDGETRWVLFSGTRINFQGSGAVLGTATDISERKEMEEALRKSEERFRKISDSAPVGIFQFQMSADGDMSFPYISEKFTEMTGLATEKIYEDASVLLDGVHDDIKDDFFEKMVMSAKNLQEFKYVGLYNARGGDKWIEVRSTPSRREDGSILWDGVFIDVDKQKKAEDALQKSEERLNTILSHTPAVIYSYQMKNGIPEITYLSESVKRILGFYPEDFVGKPEFFMSRIHPEDMNKGFEAVLNMSRNETAIIEYRFKDDSGKYRWIRDESRLFFQENGIQEIIGAWWDITERKEAEQELRMLKEGLEELVDRRTAELRESEEYKRSILELIPDLMIRTNIHGEYLDIISGSEDMLIGSKEELIGKKISDIFSEKDCGYFMEHLEKCIKNHELREVEYEIPILDTEHWFEARIVPSGDGEALALVRDITEKKNAEKRLRQKNEELEAFAYSTSHDMKAPLRAIEGFSHALMEDCKGSLDQNAVHYAQRIVDATGRMNDLIQDLFEYSRITTKDIELSEVSLDEVVDNVLERMEKNMEFSNVTVSKPLPHVKGNPSILAQILTNLLSNAIKFVEPGDNPDVTIRAESKMDRIRLWVEDNGIGIHEDYHEQIFEIFERLHGRESYPGTGAGLAIVKKGIERMGGEVGVESKHREGSRFWIELQSR